MSNYLIVDTSSKYMTVLARKGEKLALRYAEDCACAHSVALMDGIDGALKEAGLTCAECDFFGAVTGPGSFTGIRIGVSTVKGLALACGKPLLAITSFDMLAYNVEDKNFITAIDALHSRYYARGYSARGVASSAPLYLGAEEIEAEGKPVYGFEDLPFKNYTRLSPAECLARAAEELKGNLSDDIAALYVRKSQAEESLKCN